MTADRRDRRVRGPKLLVAALVLTSVSPFALDGCASTTRAQRAPGAAPRQVVPTPSAGSAGVGPILVPDGRQDVVLADRTLTVEDAVRRPGATRGATSIGVNVLIRNAGPTTIANASTFFRLMGPEGDIFGVEPGGSASLDGTIDAHASRAGTLRFDVPTGAASTWRLLYRPGVGAQTAMIALNVG